MGERTGLAPCPFCGSTKLDGVFNNTSEPQNYVIRCLSCGAIGPHGAIMTNEDWDNWNRRVTARGGEG